MPEGDNLARISDVLRRSLVGQTVSGARGRANAQFGRLLGSKINSVEARGKHLLIGFDNGLTLHTHLGLHGSWHRYGPGERWRRRPGRAGAVVETSATVAVCFDPMTVELMETRAVAIHPALSRLGPDASTSDFDVEEALRRLDSPERAAAGNRRRAARSEDPGRRRKRDPQRGLLHRTGRPVSAGRGRRLSDSSAPAGAVSSDPARQSWRRGSGYHGARDFRALVRVRPHGPAVPTLRHADRQPRQRRRPACVLVSQVPGALTRPRSAHRDPQAVVGSSAVSVVP